MWGAAASAMLGAFLAEVQRRKDEEARAAAEAFEQRLKKAGKWKQAQRDNPLTYRQIAQAYQSSLNNFQNELIAAGLSAEDARAQKQKAIQAGTIPPSAKAVAASVKAGPKVEAAPAPQQVSPPPAPEGISPEAQQAFVHGGAAAQNWVAGNAEQLRQRHALEQARQQANAQAQKQLNTQAQGVPQEVSPDAKAAFLHSAQAAVWVEANKERLQEPKPSVWSKVLHSLEGAWGTTTQTISDAWEGTKRVGAELWDSGGALAIKFWEGTKQTFSDLGVKLVSAWDSTKHAISAASVSVAQAIDAALDSAYDYHGPAAAPGGVTGQLWSALPGVTASSPDDYILREYYVNQQPMQANQLW